jgi:hypothetical protein
MRDLYHIVNGLPPVADAFAGTVYSDIINMKNFEHASFIIQCGAGAVGTATITVEACDDVAASNVVAIPFTYQGCVSGDTFGARTKVENTGFTTAAAANKMYKIEVDVDSMIMSGYSYVRVKSVEVVNDPVTGGILVILNESRLEKAIFDTAIV